MTTHRTAIAAVALGATAAATLVGVGAGSASAADGNTTTTVYTVARQGFCAGAVDVGLGHYPDQAVLFVGGALYGVGPCSVDLTLTFTRRGDRHRAVVTRHLAGPGYVGNAGRDIVNPGGPGVYDVTVTSNGPALPARPMTIDIPVYTG